MKTYEVIFSDEAKVEFQQLIDGIQPTLLIDQDDTGVAGLPEREKSNQDITVEDMATVVDGMIVAGKGKKAVKKFIERVKSVLVKGEKGGKHIGNEEKIEKKVKKYGNHPRVEITIQYHEGDDLKNLGDTPITVWPGQDIHTMIASLNTRLRFKQLISNKKKSPN